MIDNPYLDKVMDNDLLRKIDSYTYREKLVREYAWAIPTEEAIRVIIKYGPVVEAGAGTGYWASLISQVGGDIICYDKDPPGESENQYKHTKQHFKINHGGPEEISKHNDRSLFLCWPPYSNNMGLDHIKAYNGKTLILVSEGCGGCCGTDEMFDYIDKYYNHAEEVYIPQWFGIYDELNVYIKK